MLVTQCKEEEINAIKKCVQISKIVVIGRDSLEKKHLWLAEIANSGLISKLMQNKHHQAINNSLSHGMCKSI